MTTSLTIPETKQNSVFTLETTIKGLIFLFPIGAVTVKSWTSSIHVLLFLVSVIWLLKNSRKDLPELDRLEKAFILVLPAFYFWYLFSELMNGWYSVKPHWPLIDLRYVLTVVIYLAIRNIDDIYKWLIRGVMIGAVFNTFNAVYHYVMYLDSIPKGAYSLLFFGPVSGLMSLLILYSDAEEYKSIFLKGLRYCGILGGFVALMLSTARGGLLASLIMLALYPFLSGKLSIKKSLAYLILLLLVLAGFFTVSKLIRDNVLVGTVQELKSHYHNLTLPKNEFYKVRLNGITARFELWRATIRIVKENPVYGVSRAKLRQHFKEMIVNGKIHPQLEKYDQPHNVYLYYLVTRGVVGTSLFLLVLLIPFFIFKKKRKGASVNAISGTVFVSYFGILSLTQSNVFARGHYLSFFLIVLTVLMGSNILSRANSRGG